MRFLADLAPSFELRDESRSEISAWIDHYLRLATIGAHERLELRRGDAVLVHQSYRAIGLSTGRTDMATVSSIDANGRVYFRGLNGGSGWPTAIERIKRQRPPRGTTGGLLDRTVGPARVVSFTGVSGCCSSVLAPAPRLRCRYAVLERTIRVLGPHPSRKVTRA